jgi:hypothetical protein
MLLNVVMVDYQSKCNDQLLGMNSNCHIEFHHT